MERGRDVFYRNKPQNKRGLFRFLAYACFLLAMAGVLFGCRRRPAASGMQEQEVIFRRPEIMLLVATERNRYERIYTNQIWNVAVSEDGTTFEEYLLEQIKQFAADLKRLGLMAQEYGVSLERSEIEQIRRLSQDYYSQLTDADIAYTGAEQDDAFLLYQDYYLACKLVKELTKNAELEISDNEAKVIELGQIVLGNEFQAREVWHSVREEGADFDAIARANSTEEEIHRKLVRGELGKEAEDAVFSMEEGEISQVIEDGGKYYIFLCRNAYDQEATMKRKEEMMLLQREQVFHEYYDAFLADHHISVSGRVWQDVSCITQEDTTTVNFFSLYQEYFPD